MSDKLIDLNALSAYKTRSDVKYQDKLTAGNGITINGNTISATPINPTYTPLVTSGSKSVATSTVTKVGEVTLQPGLYIIQYTCQFATNVNGVRRCGFSTNMNLDAYGLAFIDSRAAVRGTLTQTMVEGIVDVSASAYPNGRTFNLLAWQNSSSSITAYPRCYSLKLS